MKKINFALMLLCVTHFSFSQIAKVDSVFWVVSNNPLSQKGENEFTKSQRINTLFKVFDVSNYEKAFPFAKTKSLHNVYEVRCNCEIDSLINILEKEYKDLYSYIKTLDYVEEILYDPDDWMWIYNNAEWLWHLKKIEADKAWDITKGNSEIIVAVLDTYFDLTHPDLERKFKYDYDPYTSIQFNCTGAINTYKASHGTAVASLVAAETTENGEDTHGGQLASIGFKTKMIGYRSYGINSGTYLQKALHASSVEKAQIITSSAGGWGTCPDMSGIEESVVKEILNNGTSIVMPAGNGWNDTHNGSDRCPSFFPPNTLGAFFPLSPYYDDRIIIVSSTDMDDYHYRIGYDSSGNPFDATHSHYPDVDLCAPGHDLMAAKKTECNEVEWPYYGSNGGTSFATPIVAGTAALIYSVNPCLMPQDIEYILKNTTDPIADASNYPGLVGTGRVNAYQAVLMATTFGETTPITNNTNWSGDKFVNGDLIIEQGATLTITGTVRLSSESKIIIKQGARLILDGGVLTNSKGCGDFWQGIQVYGTSDKNQFPESNPTHQGLLVVKNGGVIENAHKAVTNWKQNDYNSIGGVIQATNGVFRNNRRDVEFITYQNYLPNNGSDYRNLSYFRNTDFVTDDDFIELGLDVQTHVTLWKVDGVTFTNCHFSNEITTNKNNSSAPNRGIYSIDAGYKVLAGCSTFPPIGQQCPTANLQRSSFKGLGTAIEATGAGTSNTITIQQAEFENNVWGMLVDGLDNASVNRNIIDVGDADYILFWPIGAGIMASNSTGYIIEENVISSNLTDGVRVGVFVSNSGTDDNRIYKNTLTDLGIGTGGDGLNHNYYYQQGLQFLCNDFTNNEISISIGSNVEFDGVRFYQGDFSPMKSAGNTFEDNTLDIDNTANSIVYIHNGGNTEPQTYQGWVTLEYTPNANSCPTSFGGGLIILEPMSLLLDSLNNELDDLTSDYNDLNFTYQSLIDDGNTEGFKDNIELNWSSDAWLLREKLLTSSPYLSSDVLLKVAGENVLPNGMLLEVFLANPDATKGEGFIDKLKEATNNSFPEYMMDYVRGNYDNRTLRTDMEGQLSAIHFDLSNVRSWVKNLTKMKEEYTEGDRYDVAKLGDEIYNKVGLIDYYIERGDFNKADSVLTAIENDKSYREELPLIDNLGDYITFRSSLGNRSLAQLDSTEISYLETLAEENGRVAGYAQNILCFFYNICYEKTFAFGNPQPKAMTVPTPNTKEELNNVLYNVNVYPNPAKDYTSLQWEIYDELKDARYSVVDLNGRELLNGILTGNKGEQVIDTRKLGQGVYIIGVYNNNEMKVNRKLIVVDER